MTPEQLAVWAAQNQPENSWTVHPLIDGCAPPDPTGGLRWTNPQPRHGRDRWSASGAWLGWPSWSPWWALWSAGAAPLAQVGSDECRGSPDRTLDANSIRVRLHGRDGW